jgi:galactonate dehydratase
MFRSEIACYANGWFAPAKTPEEFAEKAVTARDAGFKALKWDPFGSAWQDISRPDFIQALECIEAVSAAVGNDVGLLIEGHGRFNIPTAVRIGLAIEKFDVTWFEEPIPPDNKAGLAEVRRRINVPVAAGERLYSRYDYTEFFRLGCADFVQPDVSHAGGIMELRMIASMAECRHIPFCPHNPSGPVANAATLQLAACTPNFAFLETMSTDVPWRKDISTEEAVFGNGCMKIPSKPGLGIDINISEIEKHPFEAKHLRHYRGDLTDIKPEGASSYFK